MNQGWLIPVAALLLGGGGVGTYLGFVVQRQGNKATATAAAVAQAIDGLTRLNERQEATIARQDADMARKDAAMARKDARIEELEAELARRPRRLK